MSKETWPVCELFGPTIQGEGQMVGIRAYFVRFVGCDSECEWCDSKYAWKRNAGTQDLTAQQIANLLDEDVCKTVVLTGGNPCIHDLSDLVGLLKRLGFFLCVETQGTRWQDWLTQVDHVAVSPKQGDIDLGVVMQIVESCRSVELKTVAFDAEGIDFAAATHHMVGEGVPLTIQVGSVDGVPQDLQSLVEEFAERLDFHPFVRILPQVHVVIWGGRRGV